MAAKTILILTNSELGLANVFLAVAHGLLEENAAPKVHVASFKPLAGAAAATSTLAGGRLTFHELAGPSAAQSMSAARR